MMTGLATLCENMALLIDPVLDPLGIVTTLSFLRSYSVCNRIGFMLTGTVPLIE